MIDETFTASGSLSKTIPNAFRGNYKLTVKCDGEEKVNKDFYVGKGTNTVSVENTVWLCCYLMIIFLIYVSRKYFLVSLSVNMDRYCIMF